MAANQVLEKLMCGVGSVTDAEVLAYALASGFPRMKIGTYTGDAAATKAITGVGFKPTFLVIYEKIDAKNLGIKTSKDTTGAFAVIEAHTHYADDLIISLDADGFTVGDGTGLAAYFNEAQAYVYIAFG